MALPRDENLRKEELNFLKEELKKIEARIKEVQYSGSKEVVEAQIRLLELREKIMKEIDKFVDIYFNSYEEDREDRKDEKDEKYEEI